MDIGDYESIVGYGIWQYYDSVRERLRGRVQLSYLCDRNWKQYGGCYDGVPVISPEQLAEMSDVAAVVFSGNQRNDAAICAFLDVHGIPHVHIRQLLALDYQVEGSWLKENFNGCYEDGQGNRIRFEPDLDDSVVISFQGGSNFVEIGERVSAGALRIFCGRHSECRIGSGTEIESARIYVTGGSVTLGQDCLLSDNITLRNHDGHHIFDRRTGKRINPGGRLVIGNHVWLGYGATLLGSARIGDNSVVGTMAVTSSSFQEEVIIAGNPARVIREGICWSKDNTEYYDWDNFTRCIAKEADTYGSFAHRVHSAGAGGKQNNGAGS